MNTKKTLYEIKSLNQEYIIGTEPFSVLKNINLTIEEGDSIAIVGMSGTGKSSLLHILGALSNPISGEVFFEGSDILKMSTTEKANFRNKQIGFVFQFHHMLPEFSTIENVAMPAIISGYSKKKSFRMAHNLLEQVGLSKRVKSAITLLSGGELQRAAIARALIMSPKILLADEPTGNLDEETGRSIVDLLLDLNRHYNMAMVIVTHNMELASRMNKRFELKLGDLYEQLH